MRVKLIVSFLSLWLSALASSVAFPQALPDEDIPSLDAQQQLFVRAYEAVDWKNLHPLQTPVPGLSAMVRLHYSFVRKFLEQESPSHLTLLQRLWQNVFPLVDQDGVTVADMEMSALQLAVVLSKAQKTDESNLMNIFLTDPSLQQDHESWEDFNSLNKAALYGGGFEPLYSINIYNYEEKGMRFEDFNALGPEVRSLRTGPAFCHAILCCRTGGFSYKRFVESFLKGEFPLKISALPYNIKNGGVHGGNIQKSTAFLHHEITHNKEWISHVLEENDRLQKLAGHGNLHPRLVTEGPWAVTRDILSKIMASPQGKERNAIALFLMLHEAHPSIIQEGSWPNQQAPQNVCEQKLFWNLVANSVSHSSNAEDFFLSNYPLPAATLYIPDCPVAFSVKITQVKVDQGRVHLELDLMASGSAEGQRSHLGAFKIQAKGPAAEPERPEEETRFFDQNAAAEEEVFSITAPIQGCDPSALEKLGLTQEHLQTIGQELHKEFTQTRTLMRGVTRSGYYRQYLKDDERKIRQIYGQDYLPPQTAPLGERAWALCQAMERFWQDFYNENKDLFSTTVLEE